MKLRALIVDDEWPARKKIRTFLKGEPSVEIAGEAGDGLEALEKIQSLKPDMIFLDIQMPGLTGFEVLQEIEPPLPSIIFTTAYDQFALKAFEVRALDYLLKPFDLARFKEALLRVFDARSRRHDADQRLEALIDSLKNQEKFRQRFLIKSGERITFVRSEEITWIEADEKYVKLHTDKNVFLYRDTMNQIEKELDAELFVRVHRSAIVHLHAIKELQAFSHGDYRLILKDGTRVNLGRSYREKFMEVFEKN